jgi:hypothetical protein
MLPSTGHQPLPVQEPYAQPSPLTAPRAQPPPSQIPTDRLASTADDWGRGSTASPAPPPAVTALQNDLGVTSYAPMPMQPNQHPGLPYGAYGATPQPYPQVGGGPPAANYPYNAAAPAPGGGGFPLPVVNSFSRPASFAQQQQPPMQPSQPAGPAYGVPPAAAYYPHHQQQPPPPPPQAYIPPQPPQGMYLSPTPAQSAAPPQMQGPSDSNGYVSRPPRVASMQPSEFAALQSGMDSMRLGVSSPAPSMASSNLSRPNYYASPEDGPPYKLSVNPPDVSFCVCSASAHCRNEEFDRAKNPLVQQAMLASMRETAHAGGGDMSRKVAWSKQVLKFIERHQVRFKNRSGGVMQLTRLWPSVLGRRIFSHHGSDSGSLDRRGAQSHPRISFVSQPDPAGLVPAWRPFFDRLVPVVPLQRHKGFLPRL